MIHGTLIIYSSLDGENDWTPVNAAEVPDWIKDDPDLLARMVDGEACQNEVDGVKTPWYRAERVLTQADQDAIDKARNRRIVRGNRRLVAAEVVRDAQ